MSMFFVLITCDSGFEPSFIAELKTINLVKEVNRVWGSYDILVKLEGENFNDLKNIITSKISILSPIIIILLIFFGFSSVISSTSVSSKFMCGSKVCSFQSHAWVLSHSK